MVIQYRVMNNSIWEVVDGRVTATFNRNVPDSTKIQLIQRDPTGKVQEFFNSKKEKEDNKKNASKRSKTRTGR